MIQPAWATPDELVVLALALPPLAVVAAALTRGRALALLGFVAAAPTALLGILPPPNGTVVEAEWLLLGARFGIDEHTAPFALLTGTLWAAASLAGAGYFDTRASRRIAPWWLLSLAGSVGLVFALDALTYFLCFAVMSLAAYGLVVQRGDLEAFRAGRVYMVFVVIGELALFSGLALAVTHPLVAATLVLVGFGIKAGVLGLHVWLPLAHAAAPAPASAVLSGAMLKAGLLGWLRFVDAGAPWTPDAGLLLIVLGLAGAYGGALCGITQDRPKTVLAYSSISQMGIAIAAFGMLLTGVVPDATAAAAVALFAVHHAFAKASLFIGVGAVERAHGKARAACIAMMAVPALALIGVPLSSGALAKGAIKAVAAGLPEPWAEAVGWALPGAAIGTSLLMLRLLDTLPLPPSGRCPPALWLPAVALAAAGVTLVVAAPGVQALPTLASAALAVAPLLLALLLRGLWRALRRLGVVPIVVPPGDLVVALELLVTVPRRLWASGVWSRPASVAPEPGPCVWPPARLERVFAGPAAGAILTLTLLAVFGAALLLSGVL